MASPSRIPRTPRNGLSSGGCSRNGSGLSAPASSVRMITGRPPSAADDLLVDLALLVLRRRVVAVEEQELGAQQPDAVGAELDRRGRLGHRADVGGDLDRRRRRAAGPARARARARARLAPRPPGRAAARARSSSGGSTCDRAGVAVDDQHRPVLDAPSPPRRDRPPTGCRARGRGSRRARSRRRAPRPAPARARGRAPRRRRA